MEKHRRGFLALLGGLPFLLHGCVPLALGGLAAGGAAYSEREELRGFLHDELDVKFGGNIEYKDLKEFVDVEVDKTVDAFVASGSSLTERQIYDLKKEKIMGYLDALERAGVDVKNKPKYGI